MVARRFVSRFPVLTYLLSQINFWILAYLFLALISQLVLLTARPAVQTEITFWASLRIALFLGFFIGITTGAVDLFFDRRLFYNKPLGIVIISKAIIYFLVFVVLLSFVRYAITPFLLTTLITSISEEQLEKSWEHFFQLLLIYNIVVGLLGSVITQINKKFGPGVLLPLLMGKYRKPREEERIFMFMDLKSSTSIAEALGHLKYSTFIRDSFMDINSVLARYNAQIYQYVGDEMVITWTIREGLKKHSCIEFFFACEKKFAARSPHYIQNYGQLPEFKAGIHMGKVTAVEVGEIKRDIAYHGDTLNTTARIQSVCNEYNQRLLISMHLAETSLAANVYSTKSLGLIALKGKKQAVEIVAVKQLIT